MDVGDIKDLVKQTLNKSIGSTVFFSETELLAAINDGYKDVVSKTSSSEVIDEITTVSGWHRYRWSGHKVNKVTREE